MAENYYGGYRGGNGSNARQHTDAEKKNYYEKLAQEEKDPLIKPMYEAKAAYWSKVVNGIPVTEEEKAMFGPKHARSAVEELVNAKRWLEESKNSQMVKKWSFMVDYWTKKARLQEVSPEEEMTFGFYQGQSKSLAANRKALSDFKLPARKVNKELNSVKNDNNLMLADSLMRGDFPAFGSGRAAGADGKIRFVPVSVRDFCSGESFRNINQLILQLYARERGLAPDPKYGHFYFVDKKDLVDRDATARMSADERKALGDNLKPGAVSIQISTVGKIQTIKKNLADNGVDFDKLPKEAQKLAFKSAEKLYTLYPGEDLKDERFTPVAARGGVERHRSFRDTNPKHAVDASNAKNAAEFFALYDFACHYGREFVSTLEKNQEILNEVRHDPLLNQAVANRWGGKVMEWFKMGDGYRKALYDAEKDRRENLSVEANGLTPEEIENLSDAAAGNVPVEPSRKDEEGYGMS